MKQCLLILLFAVAGTNASAQLLNNTGFENWTQTTYLGPDNWAIHWAGAEQSTDAHSGNYAVRIHNWYYYGEGTLGNGYSDNGNYSHHGTPYIVKPLYLTGYYKYDTLGSGNIADSAYGVVMLRRFNTTTGMRDTVAMGDIKLGLSSVYKQFQINVTDLAPGTDPDSIEVIFVSCVESSCMCSNDSTGICLFLTVDDLSLTTPNGVESIESVFNRTKVAPNPFKETTKIFLGNDQQSASVILYDVAGRKVNHWDSVSNELTIERGSLPAGMYYLNIAYDGDKTPERVKLVIE